MAAHRLTPVLALALALLAAMPTTCVEVRACVAAKGRPWCEQWARSNGWSEAQIREARQCLRSADTGRYLSG